MSRGPDASTLIERALLASANRTGCPVRIAASNWTHWSSATFIGGRHVLTLIGPASPVLSDWAAGLPEAEWKLRGHLVADLAVMAVRTRDGESAIDIEALTVEDR